MPNRKRPDDEPEEGPSATKKAKTVAAEPQEPKKPKVSFRPAGKGGKKKLAPFQSEDPSYKPPKDHSEESELSDVGKCSSLSLSFFSFQQRHRLTRQPQPPTRLTSRSGLSLSRL